MDMSLDPRIKLRHLTCFLEIAKAGALVLAADHLGITQPAASKTLKELEDILGQKLFDRSGRRLRLNSAGAMFQKFVGVALADLERAERSVKSGKTQRTSIAIGVLPTAATGLMPRAALEFRKRRADCVLRVSTGPNWLLLSQLREGSLDLVVGRMADPERMRDLTFEQLYSEDIVAVVGAHHPWTDKIHPDALQDFPLILPPKGAVIGTPVRSFLVSIGIDPAIRAFETVSLAFGRDILRGSDAIWFISRGVVARELAEGSLRALPLNASTGAGPVGISLREEHHDHRDLNALIDCIRQAVVSHGETAL